MTNSANSNPASLLRRPHAEWPTTTTPPRTSDLTIVFHGLLSFCFDRQWGVCEVGAFNHEIAPNHRLRIEVRGGSCNGMVVYGDELPAGDLALEIMGERPNVSSYQVGDTFDRLDNLHTDPNDFRWLLDLEGPDFYDEVITRKYHDYYKPKLQINHGTFYTLEKTLSTFKRVSLSNPQDQRPLGNLAFCLAAGIYLNTGQRAKLSLPGRDCFFDKGQAPQWIYFTNNCYQNGQLCRDSDFYHHFHSFDPPSNKGRYELQLDHEVSDVQHSCGGLDEEHSKSTDPAPCGGVGYGGSRGTL